MKTNEKFFGIDFGTTNTAVFLLDVDEHGIRPVYYGEDEMPFSSTIAIHKKNGSVLIGRQVKLNRQQLSKDYQIFSSIKSMLGKPTEYIVAGKTYTPVDIIALFLEQIKKKIQIDYGTVIEQATFAIPVDFTPLQRIELKQAAQMAGIKVNGLISESTASYMQSVEALKGFSKVAVFDWGGGTLDISILEVENKELRELAISGINLGGDDIDKILARKLHADIAAKHPIGSFDDISDKDKEQILYRCEQAKINLSGNDFTRILLSDYVIPSVIRIPLELDRFEEIILPHLEKAIETLENTVRKAGISVAQLDAILVVGGSSEMKPLQKIMYERYEKRNIKVVYPDKMQWSAAVGAAKIERTKKSYRLNHDIGVILSDNTFFPIIKKGTSIPCEIDEIRFGVVEETTDAHFIFSNGKNILGTVNVPIKGFTSEGICLNAEINEDLIAKISIQSTHMGTKKEIEINKLEFYYDISEPKKPKETKAKNLDKEFSNFIKKERLGLCLYHGCSEPAEIGGYCNYHRRHENAESK